jgi:hypothetical protein
MINRAAFAGVERLCVLLVILASQTLGAVVVAKSRFPTARAAWHALTGAVWAMVARGTFA